METIPQKRSLPRFIAAGITGLVLLGISAAPAGAAGDPSLWCWSMRNGSVQGTFTMTPNTTGDGTAPAATYTLTDASVYTSPFPELLVGSISDGTFRFGVQPSYQIIWNGSVATTYQRANGLYTNGLGIYSNVAGKADFIVDTNYEAVSVYNVWPQTYTSNVAPTLSPAPASGLCPGQSPPAPSPTPTPDNNSAAEAETTASVAGVTNQLASTGASSSTSPWIVFVLLGIGSLVGAALRSRTR